MAEPGRKRRLTKRLLKPIAGQQRLSFQQAKVDSSDGESSEPATKRRTSPRLAASTSRLLSVVRPGDLASIEVPSTSRLATAANVSRPVPHVSPSKELAQPSTSSASITPSKDPPSTSRSTHVTRSSLRQRQPDPPEDVIPTDPPDPSGEHESDGGEDGDEDSDDEADPMDGKNMQCCRS